MIAAAHGYVLGLSVGIVLECDLIVAEEGTQFQITETSRGLGAGKYWALMHYRGGGAFTMEAALTGRFFTAEEAHKANLINRVAPKGKYLEVARELAGQVLKNPPLSVRSTVRMRRHYMDRLSREVMFMGAPREALSQRGFPGSCARLRREAQAGQVQGTLTMKKSSDRILTSHAGSLPRPDDLIEANAKREAGTADEADFPEEAQPGRWPTSCVARSSRRHLGAGRRRVRQVDGLEGQLPRLVELFLHAVGRTEDRGYRSRHTAGPPVDAGQHGAVDLRRPTRSRAFRRRLFGPRVRE